MSGEGKFKKLIQCISEYRDFVISCCSLILAIIAALCSVYVYHHNQRYREDVAIYSVNNQIYKLQFKNVDHKKELLVLLSQLPNAMRDIRKPFGSQTSYENWGKKWKNFDKAIRGGIEGGYREYKDNIHHTWKEILKKKGINYE